MRKTILFILLFCLLFMLSACRQSTTPSDTQSGTISDSSDRNVKSNLQSTEDTKADNSTTGNETDDPYPISKIPEEQFTKSEHNKTFNGGNITLTVPIDWEGKMLSAEDGSSYFFSHPDLGEKCEFIYSLTFAELLSEKRTEKEYSDYLSDIHKNVKIDSFTSEKVGGYQSTKIVSSYSSENTEFVQIDYDYVIVGSRLYHFTITYPASEYETVEPVFESIMNSIRFKVD